MTTLREAAQQALEALDAYSWEQVDAARIALRAALAEPVQEEVYWYVGTDGKYYSSNEVKLFMDAETKALHLDPPQWRKDKGDLIPLYTAPPKQNAIIPPKIKGDKDFGIHTCSYHCTNPACIKAQRDELRDRLFANEQVRSPD